jgi:hypothetical protein
LHRAAIGLLGGLFLLAGVGEPFAVDPCAHHAPIRTDTGIAEGAHTGHDHHEGGGGSTDSSSGHENACTCLGACVTGSPTALPESTALTIAATFERIWRPSAQPGDFVLPGFVPFLLPYAHAPPSLG